MVIYSHFEAGPSPAGGSGARRPHLKSVPPHFMFGPPIAAYIQYCNLKMCPSVLLNSGDGPALNKAELWV